MDNFHFDLHALGYVAMILGGACITVLLGGRIADLLLRRFASLRTARNLLPR